MESIPFNDKMLGNASPEEKLYKEVIHRKVHETAV